MKNFERGKENRRPYSERESKEDRCVVENFKESECEIRREINNPIGPRIETGR